VVGKKNLTDLKSATETETETREPMSKLRNTSHSSMVHLQTWRRMKNEPGQLKISKPIQLPAPLDQLHLRTTPPYQNHNISGKSRIRDQDRDLEMRTVDLVPDNKSFLKPLPPVPEKKSGSKK